jgi:hypothetical protein
MVSKSGTADVDQTHPIAKVRESAAGAIAVIGSYIVRADICSDVEGSNNITFPWAFPEALSGYFLAISISGLTEGNISILHPSCHPNRFIRCEASNFVSC